MRGQDPLGQGPVEGFGPPREQLLDPRGEPVMEREEIFEERGGEQLVGALHGRPAHAGRCRTCHEALLRLPRWRGLVPERRGQALFFAWLLEPVKWHNAAPPAAEGGRRCPPCCSWSKRPSPKIGRTPSIAGTTRSTSPNFSSSRARSALAGTRPSWGRTSSSTWPSTSSRTRPLSGVSWIPNT